MDDFKDLNDDPNEDSHRPYGVPIPPRPELGSMLPQNMKSSALHPMDTLNPDYEARVRQQAAEPQKPALTYDELLGIPPAPQAQPPVQGQSTPLSSDSGQPSVNQMSTAELPATTSTGVDGRLRRKFRIMVALIVLLICFSAGLYVFTLLSKNKNGAGTQGGAKTIMDARSVATLAKQGKLTAATVAKMDARTYLEQTMNTVAQQPVQHLTQDISDMIAANTRPKDFLSLETSDTTYNYKTGELGILFEHQYSDIAAYKYFMTCFGGKNYVYVPSGNNNWQQTDGQNTCDPLLPTVRRLITDGTNIGGLNNVQANAFTNALFAANPKGVVSASAAQLATHNGKQYIKVQGKINPVNFGTASAPKWQGQSFVQSAFNATGLDINKYPYYADGIGTSGRTITMYIDPITVLPVYAEYVTDTGVDSSGKPRLPIIGDLYRLVRVQYSFGGSVPKTSVSQMPGDITLAWPAEKR
ncbi:MAG TPA: hypothetical protein VLG16_03670 [Candidatus Saccharimonadales bacterium]|nr:hypothetical protein [Candidatus Saccharimonadales bacterium]